MVLQKGSVVFYERNHPESAVTLMPRQQSSIHDQYNQPSEPQKVSLKSATAWLNGKFAFEQETLQRIFDELERRFDINITVKSKAFLDDKLTIYYSNTITSENIIRDICNLKGLIYQNTNNGFLIETL